MDIQSQLARIKRGSDELLVEAELAEKLKSNRPLRIKAGLTRPRPTCISDTRCSSTSCDIFRSWAIM